MWSINCFSWELIRPKRLNYCDSYIGDYNTVGA